MTGGKRIVDVGMAAVISKIIPGGRIHAIPEVHEGIDRGQRLFQRNSHHLA